MKPTFHCSNLTTCIVLHTFSYLLFVAQVPQHTMCHTEYETYYVLYKICNVFCVILVNNFVLHKLDNLFWVTQAPHLPCYPVLTSDKGGKHNQSLCTNFCCDMGQTQDLHYPYSLRSYKSYPLVEAKMSVPWPFLLTYLNE